MHELQDARTIKMVLHCLWHFGNISVVQEMNIAFKVNYDRANNYVHVNLELFVWSVLEKGCFIFLSI